MRQVQMKFSGKFPRFTLKDVIKRSFHLNTKPIALLYYYDSCSFCVFNKKIHRSQTLPDGIQFL